MGVGNSDSPANDATITAEPTFKQCENTISIEFEGWQTEDDVNFDEEDDGTVETFEEAKREAFSINEEEQLKTTKEECFDDDDDVKTITNSGDLSSDSDLDDIDQETEKNRVFILNHCDIRSHIKPTHFSSSGIINSHNLQTETSNNTKSCENSSTYSDYFDASYESESSASSVSMSEFSKSSSCLVTKQQQKVKKAVRFMLKTACIGISEPDMTEIPNQKTLHEICNERRLLKESKLNDNYSLFENDPDFNNVDLLTKKFTKLNESISKFSIN